MLWVAKIHPKMREREGGERQREEGRDREHMCIG